MDFKSIAQTALSSAYSFLFTDGPAASSPKMGTPSPFDAAGRGRRTIFNNPTGRGPNALLSADGEVLRRRSRQITRNNAWASNGIESYVSNCIGTGIKPQSQHPNKETRKKLEKLFTRWTDESDSTGRTDFYGQQSIVCRGMMEGGEVLCRFRPRFLEDGLTVPLQLQLMEAEHLPLSYNRISDAGNSILNGIEFDNLGRRKNYWLYRNHPGEVFESFNNTEITAIPASQMLHVFRPMRPGQHRGSPWLTQAIIRIEELDKYEDAELLRKEMAAMITHFIYRENGSTAPMFDGTGATDESGTTIENIQPGSTVNLYGNERIEVSKNADVGVMYAEFIKLNLHAIAAAMGITYEMLTGDLKGVTYTSIRAGLLEFRRRCEALQHQVVVFQFCRPVWNMWVDAAAVAGVIDAKEYREHKDWYTDVLWQPPKWPWVDPKKDVDAEQQSVRCGFRAQSDVINSLGENPDRVRATIQYDNEENDRLGLRFDSDGRFPPNGKPAVPDPNAAPTKMSGKKLIASRSAASTAEPKELLQ